MIPARNPTIFRFGPFELDLTTSELRKKGLKVKLQEQPFRILAMLLEHPGEMVTREEIQKKLWPTDTFVDFDLGLNTATSRLRAALGDNAENPVYIETLPRRGYRFIGSLADPGKAGISDSNAEKVKIRLAVLPLNDYSDRGCGDYFSDGLTEELITQLGSLDPSRLGIIARTSVGRYKNTEKPIDEIGRELQLDYVLEGSVRRADGRVRISAQLIRVSDQTHVWAESYERDFRDVLMLQDEVARAVARQIRIALTPQKKAILTRRRHVDPEAYEAYLMGRHYWCRLSGENWKRAHDCFEKAISIDPAYAPPYAGLADCNVKFGQFSYLPARVAFSRAREAALKALGIDDTLAEAHGSLAMIEWIYDWDWAAAERSFRCAISRGSQIAIIRGWYALYLLAMGRMQDSYREIQEGLALEPLGNLANIMLGMYLDANRDFDLAVIQYQKTLELHPDSLPAQFLLGLAFLRTSRFEEAINSLRAADALSGNDYSSGFLGIAFVLSGRPEKAIQLFEELREKSRTTYIPASAFACISLALGKVDQMFEWFEKAISEKDSFLPMIKCLPDLDALRPEPRFLALMARMKFPA